MGKSMVSCRFSQQTQSIDYGEVICGAQECQARAADKFLRLRRFRLCFDCEPAGPPSLGGSRRVDPSSWRAIFLFIMTQLHVHMVYIRIWYTHMIYIYDIQYTYLIYIYDIHISDIRTWYAYMIYIYGIHIWYTYIIYMYDIHVWYTCMIYMYDIHIWYTYMIYIYDIHIWYTYMIYIYDIHIWYTYDIYIYIFILHLHYITLYSIILCCIVLY